MEKFWKCKGFEKLKKEWDRKLEESGFLDQEAEVNGERFLKKPSVSENRFAGAYRFSSDLEREAKEDYFRLICQHASDEMNFNDEFDKLIMEMTGEGQSVKKISEALKKLPFDGRKRKCDRHTICFVRRRYETRWGIKNWKPEQMVSKRVKKHSSR